MLACGGSRGASSGEGTTDGGAARSAPSDVRAQAAAVAASVEPRQVVASVAGMPITLAEVRHEMRLANASVQEALTIAIHDRWLIGEAAELGISVSPAEVREEVEASKKVFEGEAEFHRYIERAGESLADVRAQAKLDKLTGAIFAHIEAKERHPTKAAVAGYYAAHRRRFAIPAGRTVRIVRTATAASAARVERELRSGESFAAVAGRLSAIGQPIGAREGEVRDLKPGEFEERSLNDAIFGARPHRLYGPLHLTATHATIAPETNTGFFLFEVVRTTPAGSLSLGQVEPHLMAELIEGQKEKVFPPFILAYRRKWRARTDCRPGYVVSYCREYRGSRAEEAVDPYTL